MLDDYSDLQLKIINSTLAMTNDNWKTIKTAVGKYYFFDPTDGYKLKVGYGVNAETVIGKMILGEALGIYNENGSMSFDKDGFKVTNGHNTFVVDPNSESILTVSHEGNPLLKFDDNGLLHIWGDGSALDINANDSITGLHTKISQTADEIALEVNRAKKEEEALSTRLSITENGISALVTKTDETSTAFSEFVQNYDGFKSKVVTTDPSSGNFIGSQIEQNSDHVRLSWNKCSNYIQFEKGEMNIYSSSTHSDDTLLARFNDKGVGFYYKGQYVGRIGTNFMRGNTQMRGLSFDLDGDGDDYMAWAHKENDIYMIKLAYWVSDNLLRADCPFEFQSTAQFDSTVTFKKGISADNITGYIQSKQLANSCISTLELKNGAVTTDKIAGGAVTTAKIKTGAVTEVELADGAVTTDKIAGGAVTGDKIGDYTINYSKIKGGEFCEFTINSITYKFQGGLLTSVTKPEGFN